MGESLEFVPDEEWEEMWEDIYEDADYWKKITEEEIQVEFTKFANEIDAFQNQLQDMVYDAAFDKTNQMLMNLCSTTIGLDSWLYKFHQRNAGQFPRATHENTKPSYIASDPELSKKYDMVVGYYKDVQVLVMICNDVRKVLMELQLQQAYDCLMAKENFEDAGFGEDLWRKIDGEIREVWERVDLAFKHWEYLANPAEEYYQRNIKKVEKKQMKKEDLNKEYRKIRLKNYLDDVKRWTFYVNSFLVDDAGNFSVKPATLTRMSVLDDYSATVVELNYIENNMKKTIEAVDRIYNQDIKPFEPTMRTKSGRTAMNAIRIMDDRVKEFAQEALECYWNFRKPADEEPYCILKKLDVLDEIKGTAWLNPDREPPVEDGTEYEDLYRQAAKALTTHCKNFVYYQGHQELRS